MAKANLQPKEINDLRVINIGIALWLIAFLTFAVLLGPGKATATALCGVLLGLWGRRYTKRRVTTRVGQQRREEL